MLDIERLSPRATEYDVGKVASSAEDYYVDMGEAPGRRVWLARGRAGFDRPDGSAAWTLAEDGRRAAIRQTHAEAVDVVVGYDERCAVFARSRTERRCLLSTARLVAAVFDHRTSRAGDPLLHTHVVTANMTAVAGSERYRWRA